MKKDIQIQSAVAHINVPASASRPYSIEADVTIYGGKADIIQNGHVNGVVDGAEVRVADFSSFIGANHFSYLGEPDLEKQVAVLTIIDEFIADVRADTYSLALA